MNNPTEDPLFQIMLMKALEDRGVMPYIRFDGHLDVGRILADLPPDESRKMKRKFRKLWRKAASKLPEKTWASHTQFTYKGSPPTRRQKLNRKRLVHSFVAAEVRQVVDEVKGK